MENNILKIIKGNLIGTSVGSLSDQVMLGLKNSGHRQPSIELPIPGPPVRSVVRCIFPFESPKSIYRSLRMTAWTTNNKMLRDNSALTFMSTKNFCIAVFGIVLFIGSCESIKKDPPKRCDFNGVHYNLGDTWNPFLLPSGYFRCIKCACKLSDDGSLAIIDCSQCRTQSNPALPSTKEQQRSCTYKNVSWNHGVVWKDDSKILPNDKQCKECSCTDGYVTCAIRTCPVLTCQNQTAGQGSCCPVCADHLQTLRSPMGCDMMNRYYNHEETWHPEWPQTNDRHPCITCSCQNSSVNCNKTVCPALTCRNPQPKPGECCYSCPEPGIPKPPADCKWGGLTIAHNTSFFPPTLGAFSNCISCFCNNSKLVDCKRVTCPTLNCNDTFKPPGKCCLECRVTTEKKDNVHSHGNGLCNVGKSRRLYEYQFPTQRNSNYKVQVALVDNANNFAQIYFTSANRTWKNPPTVTNTTKSNFDSILRQSNRYKYIGKIKEGKKGIRIMSRLQRPCGSQGCIHTLQKIMERLRERTKCSPMVMATPPQTKHTTIAPPPHKILKQETDP